MIGVLARTYGKNCGIGIYGEELAKRLNGHVFNAAWQSGGYDPVFVQYEPSLYSGVVDLMYEIESIHGTAVVDIHTEIPENICEVLKKKFGDRVYIGTKTLHQPFMDYYYLPHIAYELNSSSIFQVMKLPPHLHIGTLGFCLPNKRYEKLIQLANRLEIPLTIIAPIADATEGIKQVSTEYAYFLSKLAGDFELICDFLPNEEAVSILNSCSHLFCAMEDLSRTSGSLRLMTLAERPIISLPNEGAREVHAHLVDDFDKITHNFFNNEFSLPHFEDGIKWYRDLLMEIQEVSLV